MRKVSSELFIATDDGSKGHHGFVTDIMKKILDSGEKVARVVIIGPPIMMKVGADVASPYDVEILVSLNSIMVDGTGMCGGCRVTIDGKTKFTCVDGPEFNARKVDFVELINRLATYRGEEKKLQKSMKRNVGVDCTKRRRLKMQERKRRKNRKCKKRKNSYARTACQKAQKELQ